MSCPVCFFRDKTQKGLKEKSFGLSRFEDKLEKYKEVFVQGVYGMSRLSKCSCYSKYNNPKMISWTDDFLDSLKTYISEIETTFDEISSCYIDFIEKSQKIAIDNLWKFLERNELITGSEDATHYTRLLFRGRKKESFDEKDIKEFFHIPFSMRYLIGNQRFSISGQPMIYFGNSVLTVEKELEVSIDNLAIAAFLPSYSSYYDKKIYDLKNYLNDVIENSLPGIFREGSLDYNDPLTVPNHLTIFKDIKKTILMQTCTFPTEHKEGFIAEYVLPQMLTTALMEDGYAGIIFPSTKNFSDLSDNHRFSSHHINLGLFVSYDRKRDIDQKLLDSFFTYTIDGSESFNLTIDSILAEIESVIEENKKSQKNNNDYILPVAHLKLNLEYLASSKLSGKKYFDTKIGKVELEYYLKMLQHLKKTIAS